MNNLPSFVFDIEGYRLVYDPRTGLRGYSENPALFVRELLTNTSWGLRVPDTASTTDDATFIQAANDCSEVIYPDAPTVIQRTRYYCGITVARPASGEDWLDTLKAHCMGVITVDNGRFQFRIDKALPAGYQPKKFSVESFTDYDSSARLANVDPLSITVERKPRALLFNQITVNYIEGTTDFAAGSVTRERSRVSSFLETPRLATYELPGLPDKNIATRIAVQYLNRAWDDLLVRFRASRDAISVLPWDVIHFTGHGLTAQLLRVLSIKTDGEDFIIEAIEYQPASYSDSINADDAQVPTNLPDPSAVPPNPTSVAASEDRTAGPNGAPTSKVKIEWTPAQTPFYKHTRIMVNDGLTTRLLTEAQVGPVYLSDPRKDALHTITLYTVTHRNISPGVSVTITPTFADAGVPDVSNVSVPVTYDEQGVLIFTTPLYDYTSHFEVLDTFGSPASPPVIANIPASAVVPGLPVKLKLPNAVHGDGYNAPRVFSVLIRTVSVTGAKSGGYAASWSVDPNGIGSVQVGNDPRDAIFTPIDNSIWVTNFGSNTIQRLNRFTRTIEATYSTQTKPYGVTYHSGATPYLYIANFGSDSVSRMTLSGTRTDIALGAGTGPMGVISDGSVVWVACHSSNQVKRISDTSVTHTVSVGVKPCLLFAHNGHVYVCNYGSNTVSVISTTTFTVTATIQVGNGPIGICQAGGYLWVANYSNSTVSKINPSTNSVVATVMLGTQTGPTDIAYDNEDGVWISEAQARQVTRLNIYSHTADAHHATPSSPRTVIFDGINLFTPNNVNGEPARIAVTATNPSPGGGTSNAVDFIVTGVDLSPLPN